MPCRSINRTASMDSGPGRSGHRSDTLLNPVVLGVRTLLLPLAVALAACGRTDRNVGSSTQSGTPSSYAGPQALVLRVPRASGAPHVHAYPKLDSTVWTSPEAAPSPARILAF